MRTSDPNKRLVRGEYYIDPWDKPQISPRDKKPSWWVEGFRAWEGANSRVRRRRDTYAAAEKFLQELEEGDALYLETHKSVSNPAVVVSKRLDETRLKEAERAVALVPRDSNNDPDPRCKIDDAVSFALKCGWDPITGSALVSSLLPDLEGDLRARNKLEWKDKRNISDGTLEAALSHIRACHLIFGLEPISEINSKERQEIILGTALNADGTPAKGTTKRAAMKGLGRLLNYLVDKERLGVARIYQIGTKRISIPEAMTIIQQQEYLDEFWPTKLAAGAVARLWLGARPWSELKKSKVEEVRYGLSPDLRTFYAPIDGKTGWRPVEVPPIARLLFEQLEKEGRLSKTKTPEGYHIIHVGLNCSWGYHYIKMGYSSIPRMDAHSRRKGVTRQEFITKYRAKYPVKYKAFTKDFPRCTNISAYLHLSNGQTDACATYHGNSRRIINAHYRSIMRKAMAVLHFRLFPSAVAHLFIRDEIPLPSFTVVTMDAVEKAEYDKLVSSLPKLDTEEARIQFAKEKAAKKKADYKSRGEKISAAIAARGDKHVAQMKVANAASNVSRRLAAIERARPRIDVLKDYLKEHPEGFCFTEIDGILEKAGVTVPRGKHWIYAWAVPTIESQTLFSPVFVRKNLKFTLNQSEVQTNGDTNPNGSGSGESEPLDTSTQPIQPASL